uniref:Uncharacterized protein n=1 Tax=viral metagenome TaxID=1070528 RepID=A0A6C0EQE3_9ZZZZ
MPAVVKMSLSNGNSVRNVAPLNRPVLAQIPSSAKATPSALNAPMVTRIFNVRPGCGSCGRH